MPCTRTLQEKPRLKEQVDALSAKAWPEFLLHGDAYHWGALFEVFAGYQLLLCNQVGRVIALGHTVPLKWDGSVANLPQTIDDAIVRALAARHDGQRTDTLVALAVIVSQESQGQGLSSQVLEEMKALAVGHGCLNLIVPVRPTHKSHYPLIPMEEYVQWTRPDGLPFDPWLRVHRRLGARELAVAPNTLTVTGTVAQWEEWTGIALPGSGQFIVSGALQPVIIDREHDVGRYEDPNVWVHYALR